MPLALEVSDEDGNAPHELTRGPVSPGFAAVMLRQPITRMPSVVLHLNYGQTDVDPALTSQEARALATALIEAADVLDGEEAMVADRK